MKIVIDIPDKQYELIKQSDYNVFSKLSLKECMMHAIKVGTPLPKGHGDLIDRDDLLKKHPEFDTYPFPSTAVINAKPIIEADKDVDND